MSVRRILLVAITVLVLAPGFRSGTAAERILLIGQGPDAHPRGTHEYMAGVHILQHLLSQVPDLNVVVTRADDPWEEGPELIRSSDAVFLFVSEGARWLSEDDQRRDAFQRLAERGGGLCCWHWGMGCRDAEPIADFVALFGACHGGPDRRHGVLTTRVSLPAADHPVVRGIAPFEIREEFYYALKRHPGADLTALLTIPMDGEPDPVCWGWERPGGGRSFGFSGGHFHEHWQREDYRRLAVQGLLWSIGRDPQATPLNLDVPNSLLNPGFASAPRSPRAERAQGNDRLVARARAAMQRAGRFFHGQVAVHGGYVYTYSVDLRTRRGEGLAEPTQIWVQPPGTPTVGEAFLRAWESTGDAAHLEAAVDAARALVYGQLESGGWTNRIDFDPRSRGAARYRGGRGNPQGRNFSSFDDDQTQAALRFLMRVDRALEFQDPQIHEAVEYALDAALQAQFPNGGFPQGWRAPVPERPIVPAAFPADDWRTEGRIKEYWDHYTLNDGLAGSVSRMLAVASDVYGDPRYDVALRRLGDFLILAQLPEPQPAWAQQYNPDMQPMWARRFEPAAVAGRETQDAIETLMFVFRRTGDDTYLRPIPAALDWLRRSRLPDGRLARFYELRSNRPLYMERRGDEYTLTYDDSRLPDHYGFKTACRLEVLEREFQQLRGGTWQPPQDDRQELRADAQRIVSELDDRGRWISHYDGRPLVGQPKLKSGETYIDSATFSANMERLAAFVDFADR